MFHKVISLGHSCVPAFYIRKWLRKQPEAYFFDWLVTPPPALLAIIRSGLMTLFEQQKFAISEAPKPSSIYVPVIHTQLKVLFYHDFKKTRGLVDFTPVRNKYSFLAERWNKLMNSDNRILFIRHHINKEECIALKQVLCGAYPKLDFEILAINECDPATLKWDIPKVNSQYVKYCDKWVGDESEWAKAFKSVNLK